MMTNPIYGGAYAYGKTERTVHYVDGEARRSDRRKPRERWLASIPHAHEGYVDWERFERIQGVITVSGRTRRSAWRHPGQTCESKDQNTRSEVRN